jgi:hypothetical protein
MSQSPVHFTLRALLAGASLALAPAAFCTITDAQPVDSAAMIEALTKLRKSQEESVGTMHSRILQMIESAAASPSASWTLYQEAVKAVQFDGQEKEGTKFRDWKKKEEEQLDSPDFRNALPAHLHYLALTLRRASGAEIKDLLPALMRHAAAVNANAGGWGSERQMMMRPVTDGVFARHFAVEAWASKAKEWEMVPANIDGIYEKSVLPELRRQKSPQVIEYWDNRIRREAEKASMARLAFVAERFENFRRPTLLWQRATEYLALELPNRAVSEMFAVLKAYPTHPDFEKWAADLEGIINPKPAVSGALPPLPGVPGAAPGVPPPASPASLPGPAAVGPPTSP